jgi:hypothetical protein
MKASVLLVLLTASLSSIAAEAADANHGPTLWCATCHVVAANQQRPTGEAPPFATIAKRRDFNSTRLTNFLVDSTPSCRACR